ncbi:helix-turn-helix domain-containing protein [Deinococcus sp. KNUC1210]|uniref:helix-turn-helix domain-containing protein n=1 Tax=Deinococcus sp. KNUC1210 TaxID=2917691 RepID=UPI001EF0A34C|nr:helix-turn-helix domain-containing protein [Deinococcus sp. KNUC1210]ULH15482.1 helix-turn-helix domain-containing protein [Deinococcus sp. KNUC1210]
MSEQKVEPLMLTVKQVSQRIQIGRDRTYGLIRAGIIPSITIDGSIRVSRAELERWVATASGKYTT